MKNEIEARLLECDVENIIEKLKQNGAEFVGDWLQLRYCYDFTPVKQNSWIRLRTNGVETSLTIKELQDKTINGTKEWEIIVSDFDTTDQMLNKMGYTARSKQENRRIRYVLDGVEVDIDFWPMIPAYVEFEAENEKQIIDVCKKLNINYSDLVSLDVSSIYEKYGLNINHLNIVLLEQGRKMKKYKL